VEYRVRLEGHGPEILCSTASSLAPGVPYNLFRWRQVSRDPKVEPKRIELIVPQPEASNFITMPVVKLIATIGADKKT
jgi:hypothetical protein